MWWPLFALLSGFYAALIDDPAGLRFCVVAGEAEAARAGIDPDEAMMHRLVARKFLMRLADTGMMDGMALAEARSAYEGGAADLERYEHCRTLALSIAVGGNLTDAAAGLDDPDALAIEESGVSEDDWLPTYRDLRATRIAELRCAVLATVVVADVERGASNESYGLTRAGADVLMERLAEAIGAETGYDATRMRALYGYDFGLLSDFANSETMSETEARADLDAKMAKCRPLYAGIDAAAGTVAGLAPVRIDSADARMGLGACHALLTTFVRGIPPGSREAKAFDGMIKTLDRKLAAAGGDPAAAFAAFDVAAFEDLSEANAEIRMEQCFAMAGGG